MAQAKKFTLISLVVLLLFVTPANGKLLSLSIVYQRRILPQAGSQAGQLRAAQHVIYHNSGTPTIEPDQTIDAQKAQPERQLIAVRRLVH
jgi:hypothetical protein